MSDELTELPEGWVYSNLEEIALRDKNSVKRGPFGSAIKKEFFAPYGYKVYEQKNAIYNDFKLGNYYIDDKKFNELIDFEIKPGDIIVSCSGTIGKIAVVPNDAEKGIINQALLKISLDTRLMALQYFIYLFNSDLYQELFLGNTRGSALQNIASVKVLKQAPLPLPPLNEQKRIVAKIEELNDRTQKAKQALDSIPQLCDRFRQSILTAAFRGDLTADWREQNPDVEPASVLLERICAERHERYRNECQKAEAEGRKKPTLFKENLKQIEILNFPTIPDTWSWTRLVNISNIIGGVTKGRKFGNRKTIMLPYLRVANVQDGYLDFKEIKEIEVLPEDLEKYRLEYGDILFTEGGDRDKLGRGTIWIDNIKNCIHQNHIYRARLYYSGLVSDYISLATKSKYAKAYFFANASQTVNLASINLTCLGNLPLPIPSVEEQKEIVYRVQYLFKAADTIEQQYQQANTQLNKLNQSILAKAFRGELVPQDADDEPASVLLERIRAEREKLNNSKPKSKRTSTRKSKTPEGQVSIPGLE